MIKKSIICSIVILLVITVQGVSAQGEQKQSPAVLKTKALPTSSFKHQDIGNPTIMGSVKVTASGVDVIAGGADVWGVKDEFHFVYVERTGDFDLISRIESLAAANLYTKAGLMARENLTPGCRHIFFQVFADNNPRNKNNGGYEFQYRQVKDSSMKAIYPKSSTGTPEFPVKYPDTWIRLQRVGNIFTGFCSVDGKIWKPYTTFTLDLPSKIYLGLAITAHNTGHNASAKFRNIAEIIH